MKIEDKMLGFWSVFLIIIAIYLLLFHYKFIRLLFFSMKIPEPCALSILGNALVFINKSRAGIRAESY